MVIVSPLTNRVVGPLPNSWSSWLIFWIGGRSWPLTSLGPQNHEKWRFWTPNIWVITPKNEGNVGSHGSSWDDPQSTYPSSHPPSATSCATPGADCLAATAAACANFAAWAATSNSRKDVSLQMLQIYIYIYTCWMYNQYIKTCV